MFRQRNHEQQNLKDKLQQREATRTRISTRAVDEEDGWQSNYSKTERDWTKAPQSFTKKSGKTRWLKTKEQNNFTTLILHIV